MISTNNMFLSEITQFIQKLKTCPKLDLLKNHRNQLNVFSLPVSCIFLTNFALNDSSKH